MYTAETPLVIPDPQFRPAEIRWSWEYPTWYVWPLFLVLVIIGLVVIGTLVVFVFRRHKGTWLERRSQFVRRLLLAFVGTAACLSASETIFYGLHMRYMPMANEFDIRLHQPDDQAHLLSASSEE